MSAIATKAKAKAAGKVKGGGADKARTKKLIIGCVGVLVLGYAGSSVMAKSATSKAPPKLSAKAGAAAGTAGAAVSGGVTGAGITTDAAPAGQPAAGATTVTTTPWAPSPRNPFVTVPSDK